MSEKNTMRKIGSVRYSKKDFLVLGIETLIIYLLYWTMSFLMFARLETACVASTIGILVAILITGLLTYSILCVQKWARKMYMRGKRS